MTDPLEDGLLRVPPFELPYAEKASMLLERLNSLTAHHAAGCPAYRRVLDALPRGRGPASTLEDVPFLPVSLLKSMELASVPSEEIVRVLTSSGTSGQRPSRIMLDRKTAALQTKALAQIAGTILGKRRRPMIIVDCKEQLLGPMRSSARTAGVLGFANFGRDHLYLLDRNMEPQWEALDEFADRHPDGSYLVFGFTFMVWQHLVEAARAAGRRYRFAGTVLLHGGGWKKLQERAVGREAFAEAVAEVFGIATVRSYYGMVEQVGSIFLEDDRGQLVAPATAEVIVRDPRTLVPLPAGATGLLQVQSALPWSYPGHSLLTEDLGTVIERDATGGGVRGTRFLVHGRLPASPLRGCSDTHAASISPSRRHAAGVEILLGPPAAGWEDALEKVAGAAPLEPFAGESVGFAKALAGAILQDAGARVFPELVAFAFWLRGSRVSELSRRLRGSTHAATRRFARGLVLHIAPANVDTMILYSWLLSLLCGNPNVIRVSGRRSGLSDHVLGTLERLLSDEAHSAIRNRTLALRFEPDRRILDRLSAKARVRVVFGGDETVSSIRESPLPPRATELTFADRFSMAALGAPEVAALPDEALADLAGRLYDDIFWFDQLACSSPRLLFWRGEAHAVSAAQRRLWPELDRVVAQRRGRASGHGLRALGAAFEMAAQGQAVAISAVRAEGLVRVELPRFVPELREASAGGGLLPELRVADLAELSEWLDERDQTLVVFGIATGELDRLLDGLPYGAIDRIVPVGHALDFDVLWDGQDFLTSFTRGVAAIIGSAGETASH